jgi:hypothetical protein
MAAASSTNAVGCNQSVSRTDSVVPMCVSNEDYPISIARVVTTEPATIKDKRAVLLALSLVLPVFGSLQTWLAIPWPFVATQ